MKLSRVVLTGFEPFGGETLNPSEQIALALDGKAIGEAEVVSVILPCVFGEASRRLVAAIDELRPALVIGLGLAGGRAGITPERIAINIDDARIPDNAGAQPIDQPIIADGPAAYWSTLPIKAIVATCHAAGITASISQTAGTFVCNHAFYALMHRLSQHDEDPAPRGGFIHVPWLSEQVVARGAEPSLPLDVQISAIERAIAVSLLVKSDVRAVGGATN